MRKIRGKTALVTGAAGGIGRAISLRLAREGARLYLIDLDAEALNDVVEEARLRGVDSVGRLCDVGDGRQISAAVEHVLGKWGGVDILVNNAGITYYGRTQKMPAEHWDRLLAVNLHAPIQFTRELLPTLLSRGESHVLNVCSILGLVGLARVAAYSTSKFGLVGFSESLRAEFVRQGLGVTALCPGLVDTNLFASALRAPEVKEPKIPPRWMLTTPEIVAERAIRAIYRNRATVVVQPFARSLHLLKRWLPSALDLAHRVRFGHRAVPAEVAAPPAETERRAA